MPTANPVPVALRAPVQGKPASFVFHELCRVTNPTALLRYCADARRNQIISLPSIIMIDIPKLAVKIEPLGDRIVVMPLEKEDVTASGIVIPDTASKEKPSEGIVIAVGKG